MQDRMSGTALHGNAQQLAAVKRVLKAQQDLPELMVLPDLKVLRVQPDHKAHKVPLEHRELLGPSAA
jgi:hypothetical protein